MAYEKRKIMLSAWAMVRCADRARFPLRVLLRNALRSAWTAAKSAAWVAEQAAREALQSTEVRALRRSLIALEAKDRWMPAYYARATALRSELREAA